MITTTTGSAPAWADSGYKRSVVDLGAGHGIDVEVVSKDPGQKGLPRYRTDGPWSALSAGGCCISG